ncbi:hypothetical protein C8J56DRAFT_1172907 [Mycena floridula]|nr:hypothetical protein C8J56DRAFT_1172907 [Mycena floridula]
MGRPRKYANNEERREAELSAKRAYYHRNSKRLQQNMANHYLVEYHPAAASTCKLRRSQRKEASKELVSQHQAEVRAARMVVFGLQREVRDLTTSQGRGIPFPQYIVGLALNSDDSDGAVEILTEVQAVLDNFHEAIEEAGLEIQRLLGLCSEANVLHSLRNTICGFQRDLVDVRRHARISLHSVRAAFSKKAILYQAP